MNTSVLLINANRCQVPYPVFPLGMAHVAAALRQAGYTVHLFDVQFDDVATLPGVISTTRPTFVGLSLRNIDDVRIDNTRFFGRDLLPLVATIRAACTAPIILGGSAFALFPEKLMHESRADYGIAGEGDSSLILLLQQLSLGMSLEGVPGLYYRQKNSLIVNSRSHLSPEKISHPQLNQAFAQYYIKQSSMLNIQTQRGCHFNCIYCTYPLIEGAIIRHRRAGEVVDEIEQIIQAGARYFFIVDSVFNTTANHAAAICTEIVRRNLAIEWGCFLRPCGLTKDLVELMARAGLKHVEFGTESFCDSVLTAYGKNFTFEDILISSELCRFQKIHYAHFLIAGGPTETEATLRLGFVNSRKLIKTAIFPFVGMRIYYNTPLYHLAVAEKVIGPEQDIFDPVFYVSPAISKTRIVEVLEQFAKEAPNWIIRDTTPDQQRVVDSLRLKGVVGPLWEFLAR